MAEQGNRKPVLLAVTGVVATLALLLAYHRYNQSTTTTASSLHRSNAIRRSRRRWQRGFAPRELDYNVLDTALAHLSERIEQSRPYGRYNNQSIFRAEEEHLEGGLFDLLPNNTKQIYEALSQVRSMNDLEKDKLRFHINSLFVQNFLQEEFPSGYIIGEDVEQLVIHLGTYGIDEDCIRMMTHYFDHGKPLLPDNWDVSEENNLATQDGPQQSDGPVDRAATQPAIEALGGTMDDDGSDSSDEDNDDTDSDPGGSRNMLNLLYHITSEQAKRVGYIHRETKCDGCTTTPIQGIRYRCANCVDFDLCEDCEAQQIHNKNHVFYKIRIPAPNRGHIKQVAPVWYPGLPNAFPSSMPRDLQKRLVEELGCDKTELEASYDQYKCLAGQQIPVEDDPAGIGMAVSRQNFDMYFTPNTGDRAPAPNLIYDRIFAFYDIHNDNVITLDEYIIGTFTLLDTTRGARLKRMFVGYDLDRDGFVDRKDFLRIFRALYALGKELKQESIPVRDEIEDDIRDVVQGSQPISAAFSGHYFYGHTSRTGQDKQLDLDGDLVPISGSSRVLRDDSNMTGDRIRAIGNAAVRDRTQTHPFRSFRRQPESDEQLLYVPSATGHRGESSVPLAEEFGDETEAVPDPALHVYAWPPNQTPETVDIINALGEDIPLDDVTDPVDRSRIIFAQAKRLDEESDKFLEDQRDAAVHELWKRRQFYLDEEEGLSRPPGYKEPDSSGDEAERSSEPRESILQTAISSRRQSMRSRSSSKVRFDDSAVDTDHETRSNTSSRSVPVNERWGGFELSGPERDIGQEILYQAVQRGFNELLNPLFKKKEDESMEALHTKLLRTRWVKELDEYEACQNKRAADVAEAIKQADLLRTQALFSNGVDKSPLAEPTAPSKAQATGTEHDESDHIQIMSGNSPHKPALRQSLEPEASPDPTLPQNKPDAITDTTLPQNKPNDPFFTNTTANTPNLQNPDSTNEGREQEADLSPSKSSLRLWLQHRKIDEEAQKRGGYGKLSYREFCRLMIQEGNRDDFADHLGGRGKKNRKVDSAANDGGLGAANADGVYESEDSDEEEESWSSTADLGKLMKFCSTWIDRAHF